MKTNDKTAREEFILLLDLHPELFAALRQLVTSQALRPEPPAQPDHTSQ